MIFTNSSIYGLINYLKSFFVVKSNKDSSIYRINWKRFAIQLIYKKDQKVTCNEINMIFHALIDSLVVESFNNPGFTTDEDYLLYNWVLTISNSSLRYEKKISILEDVVDDLVSISGDKVGLRSILGIQQDSSALDEPRDAVQYVSKETESEYLEDLMKLLPIDFFENENNEFVKHLQSSFRCNIDNNCFQFAYIAFYMLFITYLYKTTWLLNNIGYTNATRYINDLIANTSQKDFLDFSNLFDLASIKEGNFCETMPKRFKGLIKGEKKEIETFVDKRNQCSHAVGKIIYNETELIETIKKIIKYAYKIQDDINGHILNYISGCKGTISFDKKLVLSQSEVLYLSENIQNILNFPSNSKENINKKIEVINLIYNVYTKNIGFEEGYIFKLLKIFLDGYVDCNLYYILQNDFYLLIKDLDKKQELIKHIKNIKITTDDKKNCIEYIRNI